MRLLHSPPPFLTLLLRCHRGSQSADPEQRFVNKLLRKRVMRMLAERHPDVAARVQKWIDKARRRLQDPHRGPEGRFQLVKQIAGEGQHLHIYAFMQEGSRNKLYDT